METIIIQFILPVIISGSVALLLGMRQSRGIKVDIEAKYQKMLADEIDERKEISDRVDSIEKELKRYIRGYELSIYHIKRIDPEHDIPDFLSIDTGKLRQYYRERFGGL